MALRLKPLVPPFIENPTSLSCQRHSLNKHTWLILSIGFLLALCIYHILWLQAVIYPLITITHELGHALVGWLVGYPALPLFDFEQHEGMTRYGNQNLAVLLSIYLGLAILLFRYRHNSLTLSISLGVILTYSIIIFTRLSNVLIVFMGHGAELVLASILLYLAVANRILPLRLLCATLGYFIVLYDLSFAYKLKYDLSYQLIYAYHSSGNRLGDFSRLALYFDGKVSTVASWFFWCCFLPPLGSLVLFRYQNCVRDWLSKLKN